MSSTEALFERYGPAYRWLATGTVIVTTMAVILSSTIVNVAIPAVMGAFGISQIEAQWLSTAFLAATTATMLLSAWAEQSFGHRATFVVVLCVFSAGSVIGGAAPNDSVLIAARVMQGAAAGILQPMSMVILFQVFPPQKRGAAMGIYGIGVVLAPAVGPWIGGVLMDHFDWRYVFYLVLPFSVLGIALSALFLPTRAPGGRRRAFDVLGFALLCIFLSALLTALSNGQRLGWDSDAELLGFAVAACAFLLFVWRETVAPVPLLNTRVFANAQFVAFSVVGFVLGAGIFGSTYLLPLFVQTIQNLTPTEAGLLLMPAGFAMALVIPVAGALTDRGALAAQIALGLMLFALASFLTAGVDVNTSFFDLAWWTVLTRVGMAIVFPPVSAGALRVLPAELVSQGSGIANFVRQLGGAFGVNLLAVVLERRTALHSDMLAATQTPDNHQMLAHVFATANLLQGAGLSDTDRVPLGLWYLGQALYAQASSQAFQDAFGVTALIFVAALVPTWFIHHAARKAANARQAHGSAALTAREPRGS